MPNVNDLINQIPQMPRRQQSNAQDVTVGSINQVLRFISNEFPIKQDLANTQELHGKMSKMLTSLQAMIDRTDVNSFAEDLRDSLAELNDKMSSPIVNVEFPREELVSLKRAIQAIKLEQNSTISVANLSEVTRAVNELRDYLERAEGPKDVVLDKESKDYLKNLAYLDTDAKNPLAVRLSDGKEFYKGIGQLNDGIRAMTGSSGNNFSLPNASPTKANVDSNGNIKVVQDVYTVKIAYASAGKPQYIGKAAPGTASSAAGWQISKLTYSTDDVTDIQWAAGSLSFTNIWDNRASLSYS